MKRTRNAFTLVEVLIVVVIMGILAATVVPQFVSTTDNASEGTRDFNAKSIQAQIAIYRAQHNGNFPSSIDQLTNATNSFGTTGLSGSSYPFGPYLDEFPDNPVYGSNSATFGTYTGPSTSVSYGWLINSTTGKVYGNDKAS